MEVVKKKMLRKRIPYGGYVQTHVSMDVNMSGNLYYLINIGMDVPIVLNLQN